MKKLCNQKKPTKRVHPSPAATAHPAHLLSFLPAAILSLATALSSEDQQVLAYLLSSSSDHPKPAGPTTRRAHHADPTCGCFSCYKSFWERWDASPDRHVIHLIIDAVEQREEEEELGNNKRRNRRRRGGRKRVPEEEDRKEILPASGHVADDEEGEDEKEGGDEGKSKGSSVRTLVSFVGERVWPWGLWN